MKKNYNLTLLLCFFLGVFGIHRFVNGKIGTGILMLITLGGLGIWWLVDMILIISGAFTNKAGDAIVSDRPFMETPANIIVLILVILGLIMRIF